MAWKSDQFGLAIEKCIFGARHTQYVCPPLNEGVRYLLISFSLFHRGLLYNWGSLMMIYLEHWFTQECNDGVIGLLE